MSKIEVNQISSQCGSTLTVGQSGDTVTLASGASQTGFGRTGTVDWDTTAKTASFTAVSGNGYFVNTTSGAITVTLPASPSAGDIVGFNDYARTFATNNLTVARNGSNIQGQAVDVTFSTNGQSTMFVYVDGTKGWVPTEDQTTVNYGASYITATGGTVTTCGDFKIHTFTGPGTFTVCSVGNPAGSDTVDYMVVAGGGGAAGMAQNDSNGGGAGGAGGFRESSGTASGCYTASPLGACVSALPVSAQGYPITVGGGGTATSGGPPTATAGSGANSIFSTITSAGGGGGGASPSGAGANGGSGGGGSANTGCGGTGNTPSVSPPQGNPGGGAYNADGSTPEGSPNYGAGGGGGATGAGGVGVNTGVNSGKNGLGATTSINGTATLYSEGGGGANYNKSTSPGFSQGSGGNAGFGPYPSPNNTGQAGTTNTGGGGGGGSQTGSGGPASSGGNGGSGIVIIRYKFQ